MIRTCFEQCHEIHPKVLLDLLMLMLKMFIALQVLLILVTLVQCQPVFL